MSAPPWEGAAGWGPRADSTAPALPLPPPHFLLHLPSSCTSIHREQKATFLSAAAVFLWATQMKEGKRQLFFFLVNIWSIFFLVTFFESHWMHRLQASIPVCLGWGWQGKLRSTEQGRWNAAGLARRHGRRGLRPGPQEKKGCQPHPEGQASWFRLGPPVRSVRQITAARTLSLAPSLPGVEAQSPWPGSRGLHELASATPGVSGEPFLGDRHPSPPDLCLS